MNTITVNDKLKEAAQILVETENSLQNTMKSLKEQGNQIEKINTSVNIINDHTQQSQYIIRDMDSFMGRIINKFIKKPKLYEKYTHLNIEENNKESLNNIENESDNLILLNDNNNQLESISKSLDVLKEMLNDMKDELITQDIKVDNLIKNTMTTTNLIDNTTYKVVRLISKL
jgi:hypothetical protein